MILKRLKKQYSSTSGQQASAPSIVAQDVIVEGSIATSGELHVDGTVHGNIRARSCMIDLNGVVQGEVSAEEVFVRGRVIGPIYAIHVHLGAGAHVEGDVINETISVENGAYIYGLIRRAEEPLGVPQQTTTQAAETPTLIPFEQNNGGNTEEFRPIKVVRPR